MHNKLVRIAGRTAVAGAMMALGLGGAQAALAEPGPEAVQVPCSATALASDISRASSGETLDLAKFCTYKLTTALPVIDDLDLTIQGYRSTIERSFARSTQDFGIFQVSDDGDLVLNQVNVRNGDRNVVDLGPVIRGAGKAIDNAPPGSGEGGAIDIDEGSAATVNGGTFSDNTANEEGGAIYSEGGLTVRGAVFIGNRSVQGGAIANAFTDQAVVTGSIFIRNTAAGDGGAISIDDAMVVARCGFIQNRAGEDGGAIYSDAGEPTVSGDDNSAISVNDAEPTVIASGFYQNHAALDGGGIYNEDDITLTGISFRLNTAEDGGGFYNDDTATLNGGTFAYNKAESDGGGLFNDDEATLNGTIFLHNGARFGGGIYNDDDLAVTHSLITRNLATSDGGGIYNEGDVTLTNSSLTQNKPDNCAPADSVTGCTG
jgi:predicted outer membrane repeat protein